MTGPDTSRPLDRDYRYRRHQQRYAELSHGAGRLLIALLLFAWLMPQEVLVDLSAIEQDRQRVQREIPRVQAELAAATQRAAAVDGIWSEIDRVQRAIGGWRSQDRSQVLVDTLRRLAETVRAYRQQPLADLARRIAPPDPTLQASPVDASGRRLDGGGDPTDWDQVLLARARQQPEPPRDLDEVHRVLAERVVGRFVDGTLASLHESFVAPVEALAPQLAELALELPAAAAFQDAIPRLRETLDAWRARLLADANWWRTVDEKHQTVQQLHDALRATEKGVEDLARELRREGTERRAAADARVQELTALQARQEQEQQALAARMKTLTPDWLQSVVTVPRMAGLFPYALLFVALLLAFRLTRIRHHFLAIRDRLDPDDPTASDPALSGLLTLTWRRGGTWWTLAAVLGAIGVCLWGLQTGIAALAQIESNRLSPAWAHGGLGAVRWAGWLLAALAVAAVVRAVRPARAG